MALTSKILASISAKYTAASGIGEGSLPLQADYSAALASGIGAGQADKLYQARRTIGASGNEDLDLAGVLTDVFGAALTFVKLKAVLVSAAAANTNNVLVGGVTNGIASFLSPAATGIITVRPGATFAVFAGQADSAGYAVTASTGDLLHVANSGAGTSVTYDIVLIGTSA